MEQKQINNGFADYYYLTTDGVVVNQATGNYIKPEKNMTIKLKTSQNQWKRVSIRKLYQLVYGSTLIFDDIEDLPDEEWRPIKHTNNKYLVSNKARIKSYQQNKARLLKQHNHNNYNRVDLILDNGERVSRLVGHLVAEAFLDYPKDEVYAELHHKDINSLNDELTNICWMPTSEHRLLHKKLREEKRRENDGK